MPDPPGALGRDRPHVEREGHEVLGHQRALDGAGPRRRAASPIGPGRSGPCWRSTTRSLMSRSTGFAALRNEPHAHEPLAPSPFCQISSPRSSRPRSSLEDADDVGGQAAVRLAAEVGDVDGDAPARLERADALGEDVAQQVEVLEVRRGHAVALELLLVLLAGEVRRRGHDEGDRAVGHAVHVAGVAEEERVGRAPPARARCRPSTRPAAGTARRTPWRRGSPARPRRSSTSRSDGGPSSDGDSSGANTRALAWLRFDRVEGGP